MKKRTKWTTELLKEHIKSIDKDIVIVGEYTNIGSKIECRCLKCKNVWNPTAGNLIAGKSHCPKCSKTNSALLRKKSHEDFLQTIQSLNPNVEILGEYLSNKKRIKCKCKICGKIWNPISGSLLQGCGCSSCAYKVRGKNRRTTQLDFVDKLSKSNPGIEIIGEYSGAFEPIKCKCKVCGNIWSPRAHDVLLGSGCPECSHSATSFVEQFILKSFRKVLGIEEVFSRDKKTIGKELDIFIPSYNIAIEPGAWSMHKRGVKKDIEKQRLCKEKGIRLITIYYGCKEKFEENENLIIYTHNFERETSFHELKELVGKLFDNIGIKCNFSDEDWLILKNEAYLSSRKTTTKEFVERLSNINPNIIVLGDYKSSSERIECKCKICGHIWNPIANTLIQRRSCPKCKNQATGNRLRFSQEKFLEKLHTQNPNIIPLEKYIDSKTKIKFKCLKCQYEWETIPGILFSGSGCPNCAGRPKITTESFKKRMIEINPNIEILGEYINIGTKIKYRCKVCGYEGCATPNYLQDGNKCLNCMGRRNINTEIFKERMLRINPNIEILGEYKNTSTKVLCFCKVCSFEWMGTPRDLQTGHGCPECGRKRKGRRKITNTQS